MQTEFGPKGLRVMGIHSPENDWERDLGKFAEAKERFGVAFPSYFDRDGSFALRLGAPGWPMLYIVDRRGQIRGEWLGEVHARTPRATAIQELIKDLLAED